MSFALLLKRAKFHTAIPLTSPRSTISIARLPKDAGGVPAHGNQRSPWEAGCRFDFANPDYR